MSDDIRTMTEAEMRDHKPAWPKSMADLTSMIDAVTERGHDYGTCVYAMSIAATAAFHYVAGRLGVTGFQASCADLDFLRRTRLMEDPFAIVRAEDMLYPQYDIPGRLRETLDSWGQWAADEARKKMAGKTASDVHPDVWAHWERLAASRPARPEPAAGEVGRG